MKKNLIDYFEETAKAHKEKICVIGKEKSITFAELQNSSKLIARNILKYTENAKNKPVAVYLPKSVSVYEANIACMYSGNIFMNLDIKTPMARIGNVIELICPVLIITDAFHLDLLKEQGFEMPVMTVEQLKEKTDMRTECLELRLKTMIDTDPMCIINTSGSTGTPKGVVLNHRSFIDFMNWSLETFGFDGEERIGALSPVVFDIYDYELCLMMTTGACIVLLDAEMAAFPIKLLTYMQEQKISFIFWVPTIMVNIANRDLLTKKPLEDLKTVWVKNKFKHLLKHGEMVKPF